MKTEKISDKLLQIRNLLNSLDYDEFDGLDDYIRNVRSTKYPAWSAKIQERYIKERDKRNEKERIYEKEVYPKIRDYINNNLRQGDIIRVKGSKSVFKERIILSLDKKNDLIECRTFDIRSGRAGQVTTHMYNKLTHVFINDCDKTPINDLI